MYNLTYIFYNVYGEEVKQQKIEIDEDNKKINGLRVEVDKNEIYTFKILKTKIRAIGGFEGFLKFINEANNSDSPFNSYVYGILEKIKK